jgi:pyruvate dehydrogenase E1 component alpha subunit
MCRTYRQRGHHVGDVDRSYYRSKDEERLWANDRDPLKILAQALISEGVADAVAFDRLEEEVRTQIQDGARFAIEAPYPDSSEVATDVYA